MYSMSCCCGPQVVQLSLSVLVRSLGFGVALGTVPMIRHEAAKCVYARVRELTTWEIPMKRKGSGNQASVECTLDQSLGDGELS